MFFHIERLLPVPFGAGFFSLALSAPQHAVFFSEVRHFCAFPEAAGQKCLLNFISFSLEIGKQSVWPCSRPDKLCREDGEDGHGNDSEGIAAAQKLMTDK
ncbi:MAG: hypothetical protein II922_08805 [Succinimonas sp.]|nr:hypothetical protein [Succinimonas sp.]